MNRVSSVAVEGFRHLLFTLFTMENPFEPIFSYVSDKAGFGIDQVRYLLMFVVSFPLAVIFRLLLPPNRISVTVRCLYCLVCGVSITLVCFGWKQTAILCGIVVVAYLLLVILPPNVVQSYSLVYAMGSISACHIYRMYTDYGGYHLDFTGPLMVMVQRITYVAFALHDGKGRPLSDLSEDQKQQKVDQTPPLLHYLAYMLSFNSILAGPSCTFRQYLDFIDGSNMTKPKHPVGMAEKPSVLWPTLKKLFCALFFLGLYVVLNGYISNETVLEPQFQLPVRLVVNATNSFRVRCGFYFIWLISESICNCSGLGFSGYDKNGQPKWDLVSNLIIWDIEFGTSIRSIVNGWNALTSQWLRRCVYERSTFVNPTLASFTLSAMWHGFYPGYYFNFIFFAVTIMAARKMRNLLHSHFQEGPLVKTSYDIVTWLTSVLFREVGVLCQELMFVDRSLLYWSYYYYVPPLLSLLVAFMPWGNKSRKGGKSKRNPEVTEKVEKLKET